MNRFFKSATALIIMAAMLICQIGVLAAEDESASETSGVSAQVESYLKGFGIFGENEKIDGSTLTRAEAADKFVRSAGFDYGMIGKGKTFSDVDEGTTAHKASEAALILGIVTLNDDRMFYPSRALTLNEALTMAVRTMKADSVANLRGGYPKGYMEIAAESGLLNKISGSDEVTKADLANIIYNMHHAYKYDITYEGDRISYTKSAETTVAEDLLGVKKYRVDFISTDTDAKMLEIAIKSGDRKGTTDKFGVSDRIDLSQIGGDGFAYINDDDEIVYIELKKGSEIIYDYIGAINNRENPGNVLVDDIKKIYFVNDDNTYETDDDLTVYYNENKVDGEGYDYKNCFTKAVLRDGKVIRMDVYSLKHGGQIMYSVKEQLRFRRAEEERYWEDLDSLTSLEIFIDGEKADSMFDLKGDMVFDYWNSADKSKLMIVASSRVASGKVTGYKNNQIMVDGIAYDLSDDCCNFDVQADEYKQGADMDYVMGQNVAAYIADDRTVRFIRIDAENTRTNVIQGVITSAYEEKGTGDKYIKIFHIGDNLGEVQYKVADKLKGDSLSFRYAQDVQKSYEGAGFLEFTLNGANEIKKIDHVKYFGYSTNFRDNNVPAKGIVCGQYCGEAKWFAILNIDGEFTVRNLTYTGMHYMHTGGGSMRIISDFDTRYNTIPKYFMLLGWENAATVFTDRSIIRDIQYVDDDNSKLILQDNQTFNVSNEFINSMDLRVNDFINYRATRTSKESIKIDKVRHMPSDSSLWVTDTYKSGAGAGFYRADDIAYINDYSVQFIINGEVTDAYEFNDDGINEGKMTSVYRHNRDSFERVLMNFGEPATYIRKYRGASILGLRKGDNIWFELNSSGIVTMMIYETNGNNYDD